MSAARALRLLAPAKINLHLRVGPRRDDGFHPLLSWMTTIGLFDTLTLSPPRDPSAAVVLSCDDPALPCDSSNLVYKAVVAFEKHRAVIAAGHLGNHAQKAHPGGSVS